MDLRLSSALPQEMHFEFHQRGATQQEHQDLRALTARQSPLNDRRQVAQRPFGAAHWLAGRKLRLPPLLGLPAGELRLGHNSR